MNSWILGSPSRIICSKIHRLSCPLQGVMTVIGTLMVSLVFKNVNVKCENRLKITRPVGGLLSRINTPRNKYGSNRRLHRPTLCVSLHLRLFLSRKEPSQLSSIYLVIGFIWTFMCQITVSGVAYIWIGHLVLYSAHRKMLYRRSK